MADTEHAKKEGSPSGCCPGVDSKIWMVGLLGVLIGLLAMYMAMPILFPAQPAAALTTAATGSGTPAFTLNQAKVQEIGQAMSDYFYLTAGQQVQLTYKRYEDTSDHIILYYDLNGKEMPLYVSRDFKYLYPNSIEVQNFTAEIAQAKAEALANPPAAAAAPTEPTKTAEPDVGIYVMAFCPYGNQAEDALKDVVNLLADSVSFEPVYIISGSAGSYQSLHGPNELNEDIREKIIFDKYGEKAWMAFVFDVNANCTVNTAETCWKDAAARTGVDAAAVEATYNTSFNQIADEEVAKTNAAGVSGSPTIIMNGATYSGGRTADSIKTWICSGFTTEPAACSQNLSATATAASGSCG